MHMLTLVDAIDHCQSKVLELHGKSSEWEQLAKDTGKSLPSEYADCVECADEHKQLAGWLLQLQKIRDLVAEYMNNPEEDTESYYFHKIIKIIESGEYGEIDISNTTEDPEDVPHETSMAEDLHDFLMGPG